MPEDHSDELEQAIWKLHQKGDDVKTIISKFKLCEIVVSRKFINLAVKRGNVVKRDEKMTDDDAKGSAEELSSSLPGSSEIIVGEDEEEEEVDSLPETAEAVKNVESGSRMPVTTKETVAEDFAEESESSPFKKPRRIKTTDELIRRLQDDFRLNPEEKVKDRAAKFGIAVGTLCQIKHNILKMPKESGRTWKSTPAMVEAIADDMRLYPQTKVKERAQKFEISVGTLCRIMHDILDLPKRTVQRSSEKRGSRKSTTGVQVELGNETSAKTALKPVRKRARRASLPPTQVSLGSIMAKDATSQLCQMQLKSETDGQVLVVTFDPTSAVQIGNDGVANMSTDEVIWVVNSTSDLDPGSNGETSITTEK